MLHSFFSTPSLFSIDDPWILLKKAYIFFDVVDRFQLVSFSILSSGKRYILTLIFIRQSNFYILGMITAEFGLLFHRMIFFNFDVFVFPLMADVLSRI